PNEADDGIDELRGIIDTVHERHAVLSRAVRTTGKRGGGQAQREHVLIANLDAALFVFSAAQPTPNWKLLDRLLVSAEANLLDEVVIVINKVDVMDEATLMPLLKPYQDMGYPILFTSAMENTGIDALREQLKGKISVLTGPSGVGKTSLLNSIRPGLARATNSISDYSQEGMHTTRDSALIKLDDNSYLADTPGIRRMSVWDIEPEELDGYFLDIADYVPNCKFANCAHESEPSCAVKAAVEAGDISQRRYEHFLELRGELKDALAVY
ncbi:MAG: ribosome small subunit-dependent GTPase A, partial [Chloroflexota bacterium]